MLSGKELILATRPYSKEIRWKSWYHTIVVSVLLIALLYGTFFVPFVIGRIACSIFAGLVMVRFFVIYHDHQHHTILYKSIPANIIFTIFGYYMLAPTSIWKRSHDYHHNHNSKLFSASIGSYPIMNRNKFLKSSKQERRSYLAIRHPLTILFGYLSMFAYGMCVQSFVTSPRKHWDSLVALLIHFSASAFLFIHFGWLTWLLSVFIPFMVAESLGAYLFYAQHNFPGVTFKSNTDWTYAGAALDSSSYMVMNPFWRWVTANIGFHHIHHINSRIPFYRLPEVLENIPELQKCKTTSLNPSDIISCFRLKVWDPDQNKMIGLNELKGVS